MAFGASEAARWQATHLDEIELDLLEHKLVSRDFREVQQIVDDTQEVLTSRLNDSLLRRCCGIKSVSICSSAVSIIALSGVRIRATSIPKIGSLN